MMEYSQQPKPVLQDLMAYNTEQSNFFSGLTLTSKEGSDKA